MDDMLQVHDANQPVIFGIRHLSPAGAWHLRELLDKLMPELVLIEGPSDFQRRLCACQIKTLNLLLQLWHIHLNLLYVLYYIHLPDIHLNTSGSLGT